SILDKGASFSIGVTQSISSNTNRIYDSDDDKWVENRSKILYGPLAMKKNQSISKSNKEASSSLKSNIRTNWSELDAYKDKETGTLLET
ncbi:hypothetical protein H5410_008001, partial [Solanum commersonii]